MSSKVYNFSSDYDIETQKRCYNCGYVYDKTPEYEYDTWNGLPILQREKEKSNK